ncbi:MAG TPA: WYL domain-containing protein [Lacibacter sp.]|nr:WYL domain-containing protein [Lacibacter sp.]HMO88264.1 WYL domain-containing protein [Lacibacter sp.]HMP87651.1 WYL domain-containing protein [Lacibacter sp.]
MPSNKHAVIRYRIIDRCLRNPMRRYPSKDYLRRQISEQLFGEGSEGISVSSVEKDLLAMREDAALGYNAPIRYHKVHKGYYYDDPDYSIDGMGLTEQDSQALREAAGVLTLFTDIPVFANLKEAIEKISTRFSLSDDLGDPVVDQYVQFEQPVTTRGKEWIRPLYAAIVERRPVRFLYNNVYKNETREHQLDPYLLKEVRNKWYLIGWNNKYSNFTTYALDRITSLDTLATPFQYRRDFNPDDFYKYSTGIMEGDRPEEKVVLQVNGALSRLVRINPLHHSQKVLQEGTDEVRIELEVSITEEFIRQLLGFCNNIRVEKPASLRKRLRDELQRAMELNNP